MSKSLLETVLDSVFNSIFDANYVGRRGEKLTEKELHKLEKKGITGEVLRNVYIPKDNGETSEIDVLYITEKGIFVLESKNYSGWVFGNTKDSYWTVSLENRQKFKLYNPVKQNRSHIKWLRCYLQDDTIPLHSIVVFSERCELKNLTVNEPDVVVLKRDRLRAYVRQVMEQAEPVLSQERVQEITAQLRELTNVSKETKQQHIDDINENYKPKPTKEPKNVEQQEIVGTKEQKASNDAVAPADAPAQPTVTTQKTQNAVVSELTDNICPRCGAKLILRTARKGPNAGNQFYGCTNYPNCRYTLQIAEISKE